MNAKMTFSIVIVMMVSLTGCTTQKDVTSVYPISSIVGHTFILNEKCYAFYIKGDSKHMLLGSPRLDANLERALDTNMFPHGFASIMVIEGVPKGSTFVITNVTRGHNIETSWYSYFAELHRTDGTSQKVDVYPIIDLAK